MNKTINNTAWSHRGVKERRIWQTRIKEESEARIDEMHKEFPHLAETRSKIFVLLLIDLLFICVAYVLYLEWHKSHPGWAQIALSVATSLLAAGLFNIAAKFLERSEKNSQLEIGRAILSGIDTRLVHLNGAGKVGLDRVFEKDGEQDCIDTRSRIVCESQNLLILANMWDCRWLPDDHKMELWQRFRDPSKTTTLIMLDPGSPGFQALAARRSSNPRAQAIRNKKLEMQEQQSQFVKYLVDGDGSRGIIPSLPDKHRIMGMPWYQPYFLLLGDDQAVIGYPFAAQGARRSAFLYNKQAVGGLYRELKKDVEESSRIAINLGARVRNVRAAA